MRMTTPPATLPPLVDVNGASLLTSLAPERLIEMADGEFRWVWNVALLHREGHRRELRFWTGEIKDPTTRNRDAGAVIGEIVGRPYEKNLRRRTVGRLLWLRPPSVLYLVRHRELCPPSPEDSGRITRASLVDFLHRRLIGNDEAGRREPEIPAKAVLLETPHSKPLS